ncbi:hypothetical protein BSKO_00589 [Bryopsis sp. KO-2023]|nr:hypothetical protein BSKO_00589 [Bryopsis sp. KO-2023]
MEDQAEIERCISCFRIRELVSCLDALGLKRGGKKADMHSRLLEFYRLNKDGVGLELPPGKVVTSVYKVMINQNPLGMPAPYWVNQGGSTGVAEEQAAGMRGSNGSNLSRPMSFRDASGSGRQDNPNPGRTAVVRCLCANNTFRQDRMVKCSDPSCPVWQHAGCITPTNSPPPTDFFCDGCRCQRADPFWENVGVTVLPFTKLRFNGHQIQAGTLQQVQYQERVFHVKQPFLQKIMRRELRLQVGCLLLSDDIPHRFHWPKHCSLRVNNTQYRVYGRSQNNKLGNNQRDEPAIIDSLVRRDGKNTLHIECADNRLFAVTVQIVEKRSHEDVKQKMKQKESLNAATLRVIRQVKGGGWCDGIETTSAVISLKCPLSMMRIATPARFVDVDMLEAVFDLDSFLQSAEKTRKWACPNSLRPSCVQNLQVDVYVERVLACLRDAPNINEVEVNPEGGWRPNGTTGPWRSIYDDSPVLDVKMEDVSDAMSEDEDSDDEYEEMRKAAAAMREHNEQVKRQVDDTPNNNVDIIDLLSDDDDEDDVNTGHPNHHGATSTAGGGGGEGSGAQRMPFSSAPGGFPYQQAPRSRTFPNEARPSISQAGNGYPCFEFTVGSSSVGNLAHHVNPHPPHHQPPSTSFPPNYNQVRNFPAPVGVNPSPTGPPMNALHHISGWGHQRAPHIGQQPAPSPPMAGMIPVRNIPGSSTVPVHNVPMRNGSSTVPVQNIPMRNGSSAVPVHNMPMPMPAPLSQARGVPAQVGLAAGVVSGANAPLLGLDAHQRQFPGFGVSGRGRGRGFVPQQNARVPQQRVVTRRHPAHQSVMLQTGNEVTLRASDILGSSNSAFEAYRKPNGNVEVIELDLDED